MSDDHRSGCPINLTLEVVGDKWSLLIIRDMIFGNRRHFRELLLKSEEGIASNILADRMKRLVEQGIVTKRDDPSHKQKAIYARPSRASASAHPGADGGLGPIPVTEELGIRAQLLEEGGPDVGGLHGRTARDPSGAPAGTAPRCHVVPSR
jgi:DNA-binding HxlR family transcriptional regulator